MAIDELLAAHAAGRLTNAVGVGTAAAVAAPVGRIRYREREIRPTSAPDTVLESMRVRLEAIRTGRGADPYGWLTRV